MNAKTIMVVAVDPSADLNAADLVRALAQAIPEASFIGAGGPKMAEAGVELSFNLTDHAAIGPVDAIKNFGSFLKRRDSLAQLAVRRQPDLVILVDSYSFNVPLARSIRRLAGNWKPKIVQYTSPQVWASRPGRAEKLAREVDLLLSLFPFEKDWYARRGTRLRVEFVGHPMFDRYGPVSDEEKPTAPPTVVLLPGSRSDELKRHLPVMLAAAEKIAAKCPARFKLVAPSEKIAARLGNIPGVAVQVGGVAEALSTASLALSKTGTITLECAYFRVPTVALYKVSPLFYWLARPLVTVKYAAWPNLLADEPVFPEFIQDQATPENIAEAGLLLLTDQARRTAVREKLRQIIGSLGGPGANQRAAAILKEFI